MTEPTFKAYYGLTMIIFSEIILKYRYVTITAIIISILVFISTYFATLLTEASAVLLGSDSKIDFSVRLARFLRISLLYLSLKHIPLMFFTYLLQLISRNKFVETLREYMNLPFYKFNTKTPGEIRFTIFLKALSYPICAQIVVFDFTSSVGTTIFTFIRTYNDISPYAAFIFFLFPFVYLTYMIFYLKKRIVYRTKNLVEQENTSAQIYDKLSNFDVIKSYNLENSEANSLENSIKGQVLAQLTTDIFTAKGRYMARYILISPYLFLAILYIMSPHSMTKVLFFQAILLYSSLSQEIKKLGSQLFKLSTFLNQIGYDTEIFQYDRGIPPMHGIQYFQDKIVFQNVNISHENRIIIRDINCEINKNEKIAIVGKNGTGKSTFIKAVLGFTNYNGNITIDGNNIKNLTNNSLFSLISYISQDDYTSDDTILNNLKLGCKEATTENIIEKAKLFDCHEMIMKFENGYETQAGIRGNKLSGGQKQALAFVRAAVKDSPIFILDEATSAIDKKYEKKLLEVLFNEIKNKTIIMIIHDQKHLDKFDRIFFLNEGKLEDTGSMNELLLRNGNFRSFINK